VKSKEMMEQQTAGIASLTLHSKLSNQTRGDVLWFGILYVVLAIVVVGTQFSIVPMLFIPVLVFAHFLCFLTTIWSVRCKTFFQFRRHQFADVTSATHVCAIPPPNSGRADVVPLLRKETKEGVEVFFVFQQLKYIFDDDKKVFFRLEFPVSGTVKSFVNSCGVSSSTATKLLEKYGRNIFDIPLPTFEELFKEHLVAPFFVFQVFCVALWLLDEYWYYSIVISVMLLVFEATVVKRRLKNLGDLREMRITTPHAVQAYRDNRWVNVMSSELVPGDLISLVRNSGTQVVPCDLLLVHGNVVVDEAALTGESVPQLKDGISAAVTDSQAAEMLDIEVAHKGNVVFGGTKILLSNPPEDRLGVRKPQNKGCLAYVLRTGFQSSQGKLIRTMLFSAERVSVDNIESLIFIGFLLIFAIIASAYVLVEGLKDESRSRYKLMLNCIMIITSVVPPELPMELSLAVNSSLLQLVRDKIFCTEPFRIPVAGAVDVCCFDKTGTLTSNDFEVNGVAGVVPDDPEALVPCESIGDDVKFTIAGCHSLAFIGKDIIGDPMEKAALASINWTFRTDVASSLTSPNLRVRVIQRYPFSSALKRMSCIVCLEHEGSNAAHLLVSKGAAEEMHSRFLPSTLPPAYEQLHQKFARQGFRVLALGSKRVGTATAENRLAWKNASRESMESGLSFGGFLVLSCPLKPDSKASIEQLVESSHDVVMITGDHTLTACSIASTLTITTKTMLILTQTGSELSWVSVDENESFPFDMARLDEIANQFDLCTSGSSLEAVQTKYSAHQLQKFIAKIKVFARTSPDQKELILLSLKAIGHTTLMCGDGTNDVGALKQSHVGMALIGEEGQDAHPAPAKMTRLEKLQAQTEDVQVRLGDASIAAPFTSKIPSIISCINVVRQGRCTLVTTMQMYKILATNCLISAYSLSALTLKGVKFGDSQMTVTGLAVAMFFLFVSHSKPLKVLSSERPHHKLFTASMFLTIVGQFAIHLYVLVTAVTWADPHSPKDKESLDPDGTFKPNVLNSVVFLVTNSMTVATFIANYEGNPFMQSLRENKPFFYSLIVFNLLMATGAMNAFEPLTDMLELAVLPGSMGEELVALMLFDLIATLGWASVIRRIFRIKP